MRPLLVVFILALMGCQTTAAPERQTLAGAWRLVSYTDTPEGGAPIQAFGEAPIGLFVFTDEGQASISFMRNPPGGEGQPADPNPDACAPSWYCSYFGAYEVDWQQHRWTIHVQGGNIPSYIGTDQSRPFRIEGDRLIISTEYEENGRRVHAERVLERAR